MKRTGSGRRAFVLAVLLISVVASQVASFTTYSMLCRPSTVGDVASTITTTTIVGRTRRRARDDGGDDDGRGRARFSGATTVRADADAAEGASSPTSTLDTVLRFLTSDLGGVVLGAVGLTFCVWNKLAHLDLDDVADPSSARADLLAVFGTMAVFLNGVTKLDVTSALAESVVLEGVRAEPTSDDDVGWALDSLLDATPANTAVLLARRETTTADDTAPRWCPVFEAGIVPADPRLRRAIPPSVRTPILDRFTNEKVGVGGGNVKESYLPTLQALPGKAEFTYLPPNTQEALLLPVTSSSSSEVALVLGSDTPKSFTPRDIAWCRVVASRIGSFLETR